ncbi:MAG TPA: histone deacetylase family protein, partial [Caulobacteraceae bacterium]
MDLVLYSHRDMSLHRPRASHPERPERLDAVLGALEAAPGLNLDRREAPRAAVADLALVHDPAFIAAVEKSVPASGVAYLDPDTQVSPGSLGAALRAAGGPTEAARAVARGEA